MVCIVFVRTTSSAQKKPFQWVAKEKIAKAIRAGHARGTMIRHKTRHEPAPSIRAASIRLSGIVRKNWRRRKIPKPLVRKGAASPQYVSSQPSRGTVTKFGIIVMWAG